MMNMRKVLAILVLAALALNALAFAAADKKSDYGGHGYYGYYGGGGEEEEKTHCEDKEETSSEYETVCVKEATEKVCVKYDEKCEYGGGYGGKYGGEYSSEYGGEYGGKYGGKGTYRASKKGGYEPHCEKVCVAYGEEKTGECAEEVTYEIIKTCVSKGEAVAKEHCSGGYGYYGHGYGGKKGGSCSVSYECEYSKPECTIEKKEAYGGKHGGYGYGYKK